MEVAYLTLSDVNLDRLGVGLKAILSPPPNKIILGALPLCSYPLMKSEPSFTSVPCVFGQSIFLGDCARVQARLTNHWSSVQ